MSKRLQAQPAASRGDGVLQAAHAAAILAERPARGGFMETAGARLASGLAMLALCACQAREPAGFNGYVEAEFVRVAAPQAGRVLALPVQRGAAVAPAAPLFVLE